MQFNYEEAEFINAFAVGDLVVPEKEAFIERLLTSESTGEDPELTAIANSTINKLRSIDNHTFVKMLTNFPVDTFTLY